SRPPVIVERTLAPNSRLEERVDQMFGLAGPALIEGYIRFETKTGAPGVMAFLDSTDGTVLSSVEAQGESYSESLFTDLAENAGYYTGIALLNPNAEPSEATLEVFDATGNRTATAVVNLNPQEMKAGLIGEFFQGGIDQMGGYVRLTANQPILAQESFGARNASTFLATVAAQSLANPAPAIISNSMSEVTPVTQSLSLSTIQASSN